MGAWRQQASMGPPPFGSGNPNVYDCHVYGYDTLQWGHRLSAVETTRESEYDEETILLQWGHRLSAVETTPRPSLGRRI